MSLSSLNPPHKKHLMDHMGEEGQGNLKLAVFWPSVSRLLWFGSVTDNADAEKCRSLLDGILRVRNDNKGGVVGSQFWLRPKTVIYC